MLENIIIALVAFVLLFIVLFLWNNRKLNFILKNKRKKGKEYEILELRYLALNYGLKRQKLLKKGIIVLISIVNALIISGVFFIIVILPWNIMWQLLLGFVLLLGLIYAFYGIVGFILKKKGYDK